LPSCLAEPFYALGGGKDTMRINFSNAAGEYPAGDRALGLVTKEKLAAAALR
jgi:hypothetical protein